MRRVGSKMFQVFEDGKPCEYKEGEHRFWKNWSNSKFSTLEEAVEYANKWFEPYAHFEGLERKNFYGCNCEIKEI